MLAAMARPASEKRKLLGNDIFVSSLENYLRGYKIRPPGKFSVAIGQTHHMIFMAGAVCQHRAALLKTRSEMLLRE
jgi:hypothetical protein